MTHSEKVVVAALYKFTSFPNFENCRDDIKNTLEKHQVKGTLLIAHEGVNGTIAGTSGGINSVINYLQSLPELGKITYKLSYTDNMPFYRTKVKLKKEIVTMGIEDIDPKTHVGQYVKPNDWNELISDPEVLLVDTRNDYEVQIGTFKDAINPKTGTFREFPDYVEEFLDKKKHKKIAMFCTGGIRCEKSTAYLKKQGFEEVYHLEGGILKYLEEVSEKESLWQGECFVFDNRVSVNHQLEKGIYDQCYACRMPITEQEKLSDEYIKGESCPHCYHQTSENQKQRFSQREKQVNLAKSRGGVHIGSDMTETINLRRAEKKAQKQVQKEQHKK